MGAKVLVIDDEKDYRLIIGDVLTSSGMEVLAVADGEEGLKALSWFNPDIVLVDWMMPKMNGEIFCRALRADKKYKSLPVLMLTVNQTAEAELEALDFGVDDFIVKPFKPSELLARLEAAMRRPKAPKRRRD